MILHVMRIGGIAWLLAGIVVMGLFSPVLCQLSDTTETRQVAPDPAVYASFFRQASESADASGFVILGFSKPGLSNGGPVQEALGLTDEQTKALNAVAADCTAELQSFDRSAGPSIFEFRLELMGSKPVSRASQKLKELESERTQIVLDHVRELKAALGELQFQAVDSYLRSKKNGGLFLPLVPGRT